MRAYYCDDGRREERRRTADAPRNARPRSNIIKLKASLRPSRARSNADEIFTGYKEVTSSTVFRINCCERARALFPLITGSRRQGLEKWSTAAPTRSSNYATRLLPHLQSRDEVVRPSVPPSAENPPVLCPTRRPDRTIIDSETEDRFNAEYDARARLDLEREFIRRAAKSPPRRRGRRRCRPRATRSRDDARVSARTGVARDS